MEIATNLKRSYRPEVQLSSSLLSVQSRSPSHMYDRGIHWPFVHRNWVVSSQPVGVHKLFVCKFSLVLNSLGL